MCKHGTYHFLYKVHLNALFCRLTMDTGKSNAQQPHDHRHPEYTLSVQLRID